MSIIFWVIGYIWGYLAHTASKSFKAGADCAWLNCENKEGNEYD